MKNEHLNKLLSLSKYAAHQLNDVINEFTDVLKSGQTRVDVDIDAETPGESHISLAAYWNGNVDGLRVDRDDPTQDYLYWMPLLDDARDQAEVDGLITKLRGKCEQAREAIKDV